MYILMIYICNELSLEFFSDHKKSFIFYKLFQFFPRWDGMQIITMELLEVGTKQGTSASNNKKFEITIAYYSFSAA